MGLQISLGFQQQLIVLVLPLPLGLHLSPLRPSIIINGSYTNDQPCLYDVLGLFKSASGHGPFKCFMVLVLIWVPPTTGELFYLRIMLTTCKGPTSFEDIRTVANVLYPTYRETCFTMSFFAR